MHSKRIKEMQKHKKYNKKLRKYGPCIVSDYVTQLQSIQ